jgi:hypothetical protein
MGFFKNFVKALTNPATLIAAAAAVFLAPTTGGSSLVFFAKAYVITAASTAALQTFSPKPKLPSFSDFSSQSQNRTQMIKQPTVARRMIYGETRVSGVLGFAESTENDKYLHLVILMASHEVNSIGQIYINDTAITLDGSGNCTAPTQYANLIRINKHLGSPTQAADTDLIAESNGKWTADHKLSGIAYVYARLEFNADAFPNGLPNISAIVQGKKLYDPRTSTTVYSTNPALAIRDYLTDSIYGFNASSDEIDDTSFTTAADICDENVALSGGGTESRYTINGTFESNGSPKQILENLLTSMGGSVIFSNGTFKTKAAKYVTPTVTLDEGDLRGSIALQSRRSRRDNFNAVKGVFTSPNNNYIAADYPAFTSTTFQNEDNGDQVFLDLDLPYTTSSPMAQRLAKIALFRNRQQVTLDMPCKLKAFQLNVGDTVSINNTRFGFSSKVFEVAEWNIAFENDGNGVPIMGVDLVLRELNSAVYDWNAEEKVFQQDNTILPDPFVVTTPSISVSDELRVFNEEAVSVLTVNVVSGSARVIDFEVQAKKAVDTQFINLGKSSANLFELVNVEDGAVYDVRARGISRLSKSDFVTAQHQVVGKTEPPADVTNFQVNIIGTEAHLSWTPVADLDLSHYIIRHSPLTTGAIFSNATTLVDKVSRPANTVTVPALTGTYFVRSVDKLGLASANATSNVTLIDDIKNLNLVATSTQHPSFTGSKTDVVKVDSALILNTGLFDDTAGDFDDALGSFDGGAGSVVSSGTYDFDAVIDTGGVYTSRITARVISERVDYVNTFDDASGLFDDREGQFDGDVSTFGDVNVELQIATTRDDPSSGSPTYTAFQKFNVGDYVGRGFKFRAVLKSADLSSTPKITQLSVTVDMPDRVYSENDIASGTDTNGKAVTFTPAFKEISGIGISASNLTSGDYYVITNKSATGFTIEFFNSSDATVDRTFDYVVRGYGELAA